MLGYTKDTLKSSIEKKRQQLNAILGRENVGKQDILELSTELDGLIVQYYHTLEK